MRLRQDRRDLRRGAVAPLMAILLVFLIGMVAFSVDMGYIVLVHEELQNTADAAAMAGAARLLDRSELQGTPDKSLMMSNARAEARKFALKNTGGGATLDLIDNPSNNPQGDVVCGYLANPQDRTQEMTYDQLPNSVRVRVRRDQEKNGSLALFFARVIGTPTIDLEATATATYQGQITGFRMQTPGTNNCKLLPFALDINIWNQVVAGSGPDGFSVNPDTGAVTTGADGIHECKLFPLSNGSGKGGLPAGNFGTVDLGAPNNSTADLTRQILSGPNTSDFSYFPNSTIELNPVTGTLILQGDTGVSAGCKDELASIIGQPRVIPLYSSVTGQGNNARYTIVGFAGITITEVVLTGSLASKHLTIQPSFAIDPNAIGGTSTSTTSWFVYRPVALSR